MENNTIINSLEPSLIDDYNNGSTPLPGEGISTIKSSNVNLRNNNIIYFESGAYIKDPMKSRFQTACLVKTTMESSMTRMSKIQRSSTIQSQTISPG